MSCPPHNKVWSCINTCAAAIVGTWAVQPKDCRIESINISLKVLEPDTNNRNSNHNEIAKRLQQKLTVIRPLDNIFCKTKPVPTTSTPTSRDGNSAAYAAARCCWCTAPRSVATKICITSQHQRSAAYKNFLHFFYNYCWWFSLYEQQWLVWM